MKILTTILLFIAVLISINAQTQGDYLPVTDPLNQITDSDGTLITLQKCQDYYLAKDGANRLSGILRICNDDEYVHFGAYTPNGFKDSANKQQNIQIYFGVDWAQAKVQPTSKYPFIFYAAGTYFYAKIKISDALSMGVAGNCNSLFTILFSFEETQGQGWGAANCVDRFAGNANHCEITYQAECSVTVPVCLYNPLALGCPPLACQTAFSYGTHVFAPVSPNPSPKKPWVD